MGEFRANLYGSAELGTGPIYSHNCRSGLCGELYDFIKQAIVGFIIVAILQALGTFARFYWVTWLGERVTADLRKEVFSHIIWLQPAYFEENLSGEIQSRITTDTTLIQSVIGSSVSIALRNLLLMLGGIIFFIHYQS